jgi:HEPN domain-containing protein
MHQAAERLYNAILLVFTHYKPKTHDLDTLRKLTGALDHKFIQAFPLNNAEEVRLFKLLRDAHIDARYSKNYVITEQELLWLSERIKMLQQLVEKLCLEKMQTF